MTPPLVATLCCAIVTGLANPSVAQYESDTRVNVTGVPIIDNGDALGWGVGGMALFLYPLSTDDTVSPPSATGVFGYVTTNETWVVGVAQKFFFRQDNLPGDADRRKGRHQLPGLPTEPVADSS